MGVMGVLPARDGALPRGMGEVANKDGLSNGCWLTNRILVDVCLGAPPLCMLRGGLKDIAGESDALSPS